MGGGVFANEKGVCKKRVANNSYAGDSNILTSAEVRRCMPLFHRTFKTFLLDDLGPIKYRELATRVGAKIKFCRSDIMAPKTLAGIAGNIVL